VFGDSRLQCQLRVLPFKNAKLPPFKVFIEQKAQQVELTSYPSTDGGMYYLVGGGSDVNLKWKTT
jgi:hypothetical protein